MKKTYIILSLLITLFTLNAETLFEILDNSGEPVFSISDDGLRVFNMGDTLMVISASEIKANLSNSKDRGLSRSFSVTTSASKGAKALEVTSKKNTMGSSSGEYANFSPENIFLGLNAGSQNEGMQNVFVGNDAGLNDSEGWSNVFVGANSGYSNISGSANVFIGLDAGKSNTTAATNTYVGCSAGFSSTGDQNAFFGYSSGYSNDGSYNSFFGQNAGSMNSSGSNSCLFGYFAGVQCNGDQNVYIGSRSGYQNETGSGNVFIGYYSGHNELGSNRLYIDNSDTSSPLIYGEFDTNTLKFNSNYTYAWHPSGVDNGLFIKNTSATSDWHLYHSTTHNLYLFHGSDQRGTFNYATGVYSSISDIRFKKNIEDLANILDKVMLLQPKRYNFISQGDKDIKHTGLIAQEVEKLFPEFVQYNEESEIYTMDYAGLSVIAIQAIKELRHENEELKERLKKIERIIEEIQNEK
ncbi:MAG: tail fiber domain-containing protein [Candidatus Delongbacteria bacterium]|nr:tail fiber domain-containing protein [Candidatus Delongbacteria bacterium]